MLYHYVIEHRTEISAAIKEIAARLRTGRQNNKYKSKIEIIFKFSRLNYWTNQHKM